MAQRAWIGEGGRVTRRGFIRGAAATGAAMSLAGGPAAASRTAMAARSKVGKVYVRGRQTGAEYGSDVVVDVMKALGIKYAALNPGSTFRGIHDSIVNYGGNETPEVIEVCDEEVSVALAHGYAKATGQPIAAICHDTVGLHHATMGIWQAWTDKVPVIVMGGSGPMDLTRRRPWIDWIHTSLVEGNLVRDFVKWDDQPGSAAAIPESLLMAHRVAMTEPQGPVYLCYDVGIQESELSENVFVPAVEGYAPHGLVLGDPADLRRAARLLLEAQFPVVVAGRLGRKPDAVKDLVRLAETVGAGVLDLGTRFNMPNNHGLDLTGAEAEMLRQADVVLALDVVDLFGATSATDPATRLPTSILKPDVKIITVTMDDMGIKGWNYGSYQRLTPTEIDICADTMAAVPFLAEECSRGMTSSRRAAIEQRASALQRRHGELRAMWQRRAQEAWASNPMSTARLAAETWEVIKNQDWVLANGEMSGWARQLWEFTKPYQWMGPSGGAGLGYGVPASTGVALAHKGTGRIVVDFQPDGDLMYTASALWTAAHHRIPLLTIMFNNRTYWNSENHADVIARARGRSPAMRHIGTRLDDPPPDFAKLAEAQGWYGEGPIEDPDDVGPALRRALEVVRGGTPALVDTVTQVR